MKLFISTPCLGGRPYGGYVDSLMSSVNAAINEGLITGLNIHRQDKESLIHRARNRAARSFLESGFDKLLTIDADITWTYEDLKRIITSDKDIVGGVYPIKAFPTVANFNPLPGQGGRFDLLGLEDFAQKYADPETGEAEVRHIPTGFLCVTRRVFEALTHLAEPYEVLDARTGLRESFHAFYPSQVHGGSLESEDFGFCRLAHEAGFPIFINTKVLLGHIGDHTYHLGEVDPRTK